MTEQGSSSSSSSSFSDKWTYDVFLSFRGTDTRTGFTGNLYIALCRRGFRTFIDDAELRRGEEITPGLLKAIEKSRIFIVVFSENYASSRFTLDELVKIIDCIKEKGRLLLPIFYKVDPAQVRHQTGSYGEALANHERAPYHGPDKVEKWKSALRKAANLSGYPYEGLGLDYEYEFIEKVIREVSTKINGVPLHIADHTVGLESRVLEVNSLLDVGSDEGVIMIGIYGVGGIGKSTIARAVYDLTAKRFESTCFLANVREKSFKQGLEQLQETLHFELTSESDIKFGDVYRGIPILKSRLHEKKVLLVLDDIDRLEQLQALAGGEDWFGSGSRIIITTRDTHLLCVHGIERRYHVKELNHKEALELFNWKAFKRSTTDPDFLAISKRAVLCGRGLPLALEVIGSNLYGKTIDEWNSALEKYEENSDEQVQEVLKVSYNSLKQDEKEVFLDLACFFNGETFQYVKKMLLHSRGISQEYDIGVLIAKSLIKITKYLKSEEKVEMHHLIQDMGRNIVKQESPLEPGGRSRLWLREDIIHVLEENTGTDKIQFIVLDMAKHEVQWSGKGFKKMKNLRVLIIKDVNFSRSPRYLPSSLIVLDWKGYPLSSLPSQFHPKNLAILNLCDSFFTLDKALKKFEQLKEIKLNCCKFLEQVPDLSEVPNLTELHLDFCENLIEIHDSVGFLDKLRVISAKSCVNLKNFPRFMKLKSLEILNLECCLSLKFFPEIVGKMGNLSHISLRKSAIEELPCSIENVTRILHLDLSYCHKLSKVPPRILMSPVLELLNVGESSRFGFMKKLGEQEQVTLYHKRVWLRGCNFLDGFLPTFLGLSPNITELEICRCNFTILPECIQVFKFLIHLNLDNCKQLQEIRGVPQNIKVFSARNCTSLMPSASNINIILDQSIHSRGNTKFILPGTWIPKWFDHFGKEACLSFWFRNELPEIAIFVIGGPNRNPQLLRFNCKVYVNGLLLMKRNHRDRSIVTPDIWNHDDGKLKTKHTYLRCKLNERPDEVYFPEDKWNHAKISFEIRELQHFSPRGRNLVQQTGIYIYNRARIERDILFTNPNLHLNPEPSKEQLKRKSQLLD